MKRKKVVLAFSGGLDTSYCAKYLALEHQLEVHSAVVNTGGFTHQELLQIEKRAHDLGVCEHTVLEEIESFYCDIVRYLIYGNVLRNGNYPLSVSAERVHQAIALARYAKSIDADYLAHGSTGAGNDQVRFDLIFQLVAPGIEVLTPIRDQRLSRQEEVEYLAKNGYDVPWQQANYSINQGLWGTSVGGKETLTSNKALPSSAYPSALEAENPQTLSLTFSKGELTAVDGVEMLPVDAIVEVEKIASRYAIGRDVHVGDTLIGIKGRVGFAAAAALVIIKAHHQLEKHTLSKWQLYWKEQLANWYGMFLHEAQYLEPVMRNIEGFLRDSQKNVSGEVQVALHPYRFEVLGVESPHDLMQADFAQYGEMNHGWTGDDVKGFTKLLANPMKIFQHVNPEP